METKKLDEILRLHWNTSSESFVAEGVSLMDVLRGRELRWRGLLPGRVIRLIDAGFARSSAVHPDTAFALYVICRACKASNVFETGTYWGYSTSYLAAAVRDNQGDKVSTFDIYSKAGSHIPKDLMPYVDLYRGQSSFEAMPPVLESKKPDLFFQDSNHDYESIVQELNIVTPYLEVGKVVLLHDFVWDGVRRAAIDVLSGWAMYILDGQDPQQLGVAVKIK